MQNDLTVTARGARTGVVPARASRYARVPATLTALTAGGTCWISPVSGRAAARTASRVSAPAGAPEMTSPSASAVLVAWPSRMVAWYSFSASARCPSSRVAFPTPATSTPVAKGSRVPPWPTRRVPVSRRSRATTSWEVSPAGLSTMTSPSAAVMSPARASRGALVLVAGFGRDAVGVGVTGRLSALPDLGQGLVRGTRLGDQLLHVPRALGQGIADEGQRWSMPQPGLPPDLGPDEPGGALERGRGARLLIRRPVHRVVDRRLAQVAGEPGVGDRDEAQP